MPLSVLIPAYNPDRRLLTFIDRLVALKRFHFVVVVDDGSRSECRPIFDALESRPRVVVLRHAMNLGKGAALKMGLNHIAWAFPECDGVVTADSDGQHLPEDVIRVADCLEDAPYSLILGVRKFREGVPWRSRLGNVITKYLFWGLMGTKLSDTQSGLRGIPRRLVMELIPLKSNGYEFELEMLVMCKHEHIQVAECPIATVYLEHNQSSHFNPLIDSLKIYWVLLRFMMTSLMTAAVDYLVFLLTYQAVQSILFSQICARFVATGINFLLVSQVVFLSKERTQKTLPKYIALVAGMGLISYLLIQAGMQALGLSLLNAKIASELILYLLNFTIQRDFIFTGSQDRHIDVVQFAEEQNDRQIRKAA